MTRAKAGRRRQRGTIDRLPSGALRVRVYGGQDPVSGKRDTLVEVIEPGPRQEARAEAARTRLLNAVDEQRSPRTSATLDQLLDRYLETLDVGVTTHRAYTRYLELHVRPFLGRAKAGAVGAEALDSLYAELRRCRNHCAGSVKRVDHRTPREHECDHRCRPHRCRPLAPATIRHIHFVHRRQRGSKVHSWVSAWGRRSIASHDDGQAESASTEQFDLDEVVAVWDSVVAAVPGRAPLHAGPTPTSHPAICCPRVVGAWTGRDVRERVRPCPDVDRTVVPALG